MALGRHGGAGDVLVPDVLLVPPVAAAAVLKQPGGQVVIRVLQRRPPPGSPPGQRVSRSAGRTARAGAGPGPGPTARWLGNRARPQRRCRRGRQRASVAATSSSSAASGGGGRRRGARRSDPELGEPGHPAGRAWLRQAHGGSPGPAGDQARCHSSLCPFSAASFCARLSWFSTPPTVVENRAQSVRKSVRLPSGLGDRVVPPCALAVAVPPLAGDQTRVAQPAEQRVDGAVAGQQAAGGGKIADKLQPEAGPSSSSARTHGPSTPRRSSVRPPSPAMSHMMSCRARYVNPHGDSLVDRSGPDDEIGPAGPSALASLDLR